MNALLYIPPHTRCTNCGGCCGLVPVTASDIARIENYIQAHALPREIMRRAHEPMECIFRDNELKRCSIYPVRPMVCRLFGVTRGMKCANGNSAEIDGLPFITDDAYCGTQNDLLREERKDG